MKASTKIEFNEFLSLMFRLTYRRPAVILLTCLALLNILFGLVYYAGIQFSDGPPTSNFLIGIILLGIFPLSAYISANRAYKSSARLQETIEFEIIPDKFRQRGESFQTEFDLNKSYKIEELSDWFLIYQNKQVANFIPKRIFDALQIEQIRDIFRNVSKNVKVRLRQDIK